MPAIVIVSRETGTERLRSQSCSLPRPTIAVSVCRSCVSDGFNACCRTAPERRNKSIYLGARHKQPAVSAHRHVFIAVGRRQASVFSCAARYVTRPDVAHLARTTKKTLAVEFGAKKTAFFNNVP